MIVDVLLHLRLGGEAASAIWHRTTERPIALVSPRVLIQYCLLSEVLAALPALVRLFTCVNPQMLVENGALTEEPRTVHATVRLFVGVDP